MARALRKPPGALQVVLSESSGDGQFGEERLPAQPPAGAGLGTQVSLAVAVVVMGCANNISKQVATKPLQRYTYMLGLATAVVYIPLYGGVLLTLMRAGVVPKHQMRFVWRSTGRRGWPYLLFFVLAALGDTLGDVIGMICSPYVTGPLHSLLSNCTPMFIAAMSMCVLHKRYSLLQCIGLLGVLLAVLLGIWPSFSNGGASGSSDLFFATVLGASCIFNAVSYIVKELLFNLYSSWLSAEGIEADGGLNVFMVNTHAALFQLPFTLLTVPLNKAFGQMHGEGVLEYMGHALTCVFTTSPGSCGSESVHQESAGACTAVYVVCNILWNISILLSVKHSGAMATFVALKAIFPVSTLLFAYVSWPLLGPTSISWLVWGSVFLMLPSIAVYQWASTLQNRRAQRHPALATCCWPLGQGP